MDIFTVINWLSIINSDYHELMLISELNNFFNFDQNLFLLDSNADTSRFVNTNRTLASTSQSVHVFQQRQNNNISGLENVKAIDGKNVLLVIVSERNTFQSNLHLLIEIKKIQRLKIDVKIGIFFRLYQSNDDVRTFFEWCSTEKLINIFAAFYLHPKEYGGERFLHIFSYNPLGTIDVTNVTGSREFGTFFREKNFNFRQHKLKFLYELLPYTYVWPLILPILNVTAVACDDKYSKANCSADIYGYEYLNESQHVFIYPTIDISFALVVPKALHKGFMGGFLIVSFDNIFIVSFITAITTILFLCLVRLKDKKKNSFFRSVADVINLFMHDNDRIIYQNLSRMEVFIIVPLTFAGFIIVNIIESALLSHLTRPLAQPQINTIEGVYRSPLPIFTFLNVTAEEMIELLEKISPHGDWNDKVRVTKNFTDLLLGHIAMYDTSISFVAGRPIVNGLLRVQKMFNIQGYHNTPISVLKRFPSYVVDENFPFSDRINDIIHRIASAGLLYVDDEENGELYVKFLTNLKSIPLSKEEFSVPIAMVLAFGWIISIVVFVIEIIWKKFNLFTETQELRRMFVKKRVQCQSISI